MRFIFRKWFFINMLLFIVVMQIAAPLPEIFATPATRQRLNELSEARQEAGRQARNFRNLLQETHGEIARIMLEMQFLDELMLDALEALDDIEYSLVATTLRKEYAEIELANARTQFDEQFLIFQIRLRAMQEQGPAGLIDILLQSESFSDFLIRRENIRAIARFDQYIMYQLDKSESRYLANLDEIARTESLIHDLLFQQDLAMQNLQHLMDDRAEWLINLSNNAAHQAFLIEIYEEEQNILNLMFSDLEEQYQRELDEIERQRIEEERRRREQANAERLARLNAFSGQFQWPIPTHAPGARGFGVQMHPILGVYRMHTGIDITAPSGTRIYAAAEGYVRFSGWMGGYGNTVIIDHGGGYSTLYAHNSRNRVREGQHVIPGQHIADVGSSGMSTGPHLHFEIRRDNIALDPLLFFR